MFVYIMINRNRTVLYTGMTNNLVRRVSEHKRGICPGFTRRYNASLLVYFEEHDNAESAIQREKQLKSWSRARKEALIHSSNHGWQDLSEGWSDED